MGKCERCEIEFRQIEIKSSPSKTLELCPNCGGGPGALEIFELREQKETGDLETAGKVRETLGGIGRKLNQRF
jgi:hypothetical protein